MSDVIKPQTWAEALKTAKQDGFDESDARRLLGVAGGADLSYLRLHAHEIMPADVYDRYLEMLKKRALHLPVQYITGESCFCGLDLKVNSNVLIPRPETELLAEAVFTTCAGKSVLDLCTGSGCIAIAVAALGNPKSVTACDISEEALGVARENARKNDVNIVFRQGNMFEAVGDETFDIIVSNPPYIAKKEIETLMPEVRDHEPFIALCGGEDGLDPYRVIAEEARKHLKPGGKLFLEIGEDQGESVPELLKKAGFKDISVRKDYSGQDRIVNATV